MLQRIVSRRISAIASRPDFWLVSLLLWILLSASRSLGTPWAQVALTETLRWSAGIGLAIALGWYFRHAVIAGQFLVTLTGAMALFGILDSGSSANSNMVGPYHDHQLYGSVLLILLPFCAAVAITGKSSLWRWGAFAALTAGTLCLALSQTRSAWAGLFVATLVFGGLWMSRSGYRPRRWSVAVIPTLVLLLGLAAVWMVAGPTDQRAALTSRAATLTALPQDGSWQSRLRLWHGTLRLVEAHPAIGIGLGRYTGTQWLWTHIGGPLAPTAHASLTNQAHSFYLQTASEIGLIGLLLYLGVLTAFAAQALSLLTKSHRQFSERSALLLASLSAMAGMSVDAIASPSWQFPEASFFFWTVLGLGLASVRRPETQTSAASIPYPLRRIGQFALSGSVAVVLAAHVLPLGLLTPVEAYTSTKGWTLVSSALTLVSPAGTIVAGSQLKFQVVAKYKDPTGATVTRDVTTDADSAYGGTLKYSTGSLSELNTAFSGGTFLVPAKTYNSTSSLSVMVFYTDHGINQGGYSTPVPLVIPIRPS